MRPRCARWSRTCSAQVAKVEAGGGEAARGKHTARGKLLPRDRVAQLLDPGTPVPRDRAAGRARRCTAATRRRPG